MAEGRSYLALGPIDLKRGWAKFPFCGERVHYWRPARSDVPLIHRGQRVRSWTALCGYEGYTTDSIPALDEGSCPRCKTCQKKVKKGFR